MSRNSSFKGRQSMGDVGRTVSTLLRATGAVATKVSVEEATLRAATAIDAKRPAQPRPTPISDMEQVLGWLSKHVSEDKVADAERHLESTLGTQSGSEMEGMLAKWKNRATRKVGERKSSNGGGDSEDEGLPASAAKTASPVTPGIAGAAKWLSALQNEMAEEAKAEETHVDVWEKQRALEVRVAAQIEQREAERRERRLASRAARDQRRSMSSGGAWSESDSDDSEDERSREAAQRTLAQSLKDESVNKYLAQLPMLERKKAEAKQACFAAERALRNTLGRKPAEIERRDDETWGRAAMAFKEADQALFVAKSLCSWDD